MQASKRFLGWPSEAGKFIELAMERHGGVSAWNACPRLHIDVIAASGVVWRLKGAGRRFDIPTRLIICPKTQETVFPNYPITGSYVTVADGKVTLNRQNDSESIENYRSRFHGLRAKLQTWKPLDAAYFVGYSMPQYYSYPFTLPHLEFVEWRHSNNNIELTLQYPAGIDSHCRKQLFHFDKTGLLQRVDYKVDIIGLGPTAAHHYMQYEDVCGLQLPSRREVIAKALGRTWPANLVTLELTVRPFHASFVSRPPSVSSHTPNS
ncbi:MAG: hypothetical protein AAGF57_15915 [Pseudomonadota bacterium]